MKSRLHTKTAWSVLVFAVLLECLVLGVYFRRMDESVTEQVVRGLIEESNKSKNYLQNMIDTKFEWMRFVARLCSDLHDDEEALWHLMEEGDSENYRLGIIDDDGEVFYGDHQVGDISQRAYYSQVMAGKSLISELLIDGMDGEDSICLLVPVPGEKKTVSYGIVMEYTTTEIGSYINDTTEWNQYGLNLVVDSKGRMVASDKNVEQFDTIYEALHAICEHEDEEDCPLGEMEEKIARMEAGYFNCGGNRQELLLYHQPVGINDWSVVSIGNQDQYENVMGRIQHMSMSIVLVTILLMAVFVLAVFYIARRHKQRFSEMEIDEVTGVYTRAAGHKLILEYFQGEKKLPCYGCMFIDLDDFKRINDMYGHNQGDHILRLAGALLKEAVRDTDIVCRYGGDEFCIWLFGEGGRTEIHEIAKRIQNRVYKKSDELRFSIGATVVEREETDCDAILKRADEAVYEAKREGKNTIAFYEG